MILPKNEKWAGTRPDGETITATDEETYSDDDVYLPEQPAWHARSACAGIDPDVFFPIDDNYTTARAICATCPVRLQCTEHALEFPERDGMWGGHTPIELRAMRGQHRRNTA